MSFFSFRIGIGYMVASFKAYFGINGQTGVTHFFVDSRSGF